MQLDKWRNQISTKNRHFGPEETGSHNAADKPNCLNRFCLCFWWRIQIRTRGEKSAKSHDKAKPNWWRLMPNQSHIVKPNPDYWVSWLWENAMGEDVFCRTK